ncbi:MAG: efflux transporter periplasmic adaptor subunit [Stappia sp.]|uniref:efflux RND transporter periplasmic adaptor subunit n=1 Tax=Stappia sp. TaxID=1870903 RepID=UPI000C5918C8|nr:efflux RND transporter periplasmic adaptor subunit [Stappia sp.]MAA97488.1 efflux transporter periplasmic adaptor subunit [Stappia sp.]MBM22021.1 efflux transporter periplasmic adaptor subunit [Stappia sp.]
MRPFLAFAGHGRLAPLAGLVATLLVAGCQPEAAEEVSGKDEAAPRAVWVVPAAPAAPPAYALSGTVRARVEVPLAFRVGGKIAERLVDAGTRVERGEAIARLDMTDLSASLRAEEAREKAAQAQARQLDDDLERIVALRDKGHVSQSALDAAQAAADAARETLKAARESSALARNRLDYAVLTADADGVVTSVSAEPGEVVTAGQPVVHVARDAAREVEVAVPEARVGLLSRASASVTLWADPDRVYPARLRELSPQADSAARSFAARFTIDAPADTARLGMSATVRLADDAPVPGVSVPLSAVWYDGSQANVWRAGAASDHVSAVPVKVLRLTAETALVEGGLDAGDLVVSMGAHRLDAETPVRVVLHGGAATVTVGALK